MGLPNTSKSRTATVRFPVSELATIESIGEQYDLNRHKLIRLVVSEALRSGRMAQLAEQHAAQKIKAPA